VAGVGQYTALGIWGVRRVGAARVIEFNVRVMFGDREMVEWAKLWRDRN
jgi:hypothetical protein